MAFLNKGTRARGGRFGGSEAGGLVLSRFGAGSALTALGALDLGLTGSGGRGVAAVTAAGTVSGRGRGTGRRGAFGGALARPGSGSSGSLWACPVICSAAVVSEDRLNRCPVI